jgi:hypothetical protein
MLDIFKYNSEYVNSLIELTVLSVFVSNNLTLKVFKSSWRMYSLKGIFYLVLKFNLSAININCCVITWWKVSHRETGQNETSLSRPFVIGFSPL